MAAALRPPRAWRSPLQRALYQASKLQSYEASGQLQIVRRRSDIEQAISLGKIAALLGLEGAHALEANIDNLQQVYDAGFRTVGLAHFFDNEFAGSAHGEKKDGLTPLGRQLIAEVERRHMIVDLAHSSPETMRDVLAVATRPVIVSHTGVKGTCNNRRNLSDDEVKAIAARGGLIGIGFWDTAVCGSDAHAIAKAIAYTASLVGAEHVALGSDFDGAVTVPFDAAHSDQLTQALLDVGLNERQIRAIMGENAIRFFSENLPE
jgi:microsomal dipeptidase-like Zn-dependent dipeptidase